ncbi:unnamed protein product [Allacma fusca]|uniref:Ammonium transporter AmtB-like domain-containing protein n=1 Tax=Allacma fusca TaxID=39272 RepID=A0A8J2NSA8_9HEXA|nr:unnamed protein product [Allacma fusca]
MSLSQEQVSKTRSAIVNSTKAQQQFLSQIPRPTKPHSFDQIQGVHQILQHSLLWAQQPQQQTKGRSQDRHGHIGSAQTGMATREFQGGIGPYTVDLGSGGETHSEVAPNVKGGEDPVKDSSTAKLLLLVQIVIIFCFLIFVSYDDDASANPAKKQDDSAEGDSNSLPDYYPMFQDVHVMIFIGFGFLMTFLKKYGYSAVGFNLMIAAIAIQWSILCRGVFHHDGSNILINVQSLINGDFAAGAVLISFGAVLGVTSPLQLLVMCLVEVFLYAANEYIGTELLKAIDVGGSMFIHTFGAYFGLAVSFALRRQNECESDKEGSSYTSDIFAMIGTVFLWMFWPSFNGAMATGDDQHRAVLNTVLSLCGSCLLSFAMSSLLSADNKFSMVHVQNASLAGGVAVGAVADLMIKPFGALIIGSGAGILSTAGYIFLTPLLQNSIGLHDTCGVHNLHGMPGVVSGLVGALMAAIASETDYGKSLYLQYPARAPFAGSKELVDLRQDLVKAEPGLNRSATEQAVYQLAALGVTLLIGLVGGAVTGAILRIPLFNKVPQEQIFDDTQFWQVPEETDSSAIVNFEPSPSKYKDSQL